MTIREFVENLYNQAQERPTRITLADAENDLRNFAADEWDLPEGMTAEAYMEAWNALVDENEPDRPKTTDVIRFRVTAEERARIQALADRMSGGNVSQLLKTLVAQKEAEIMAAVGTVFKTQAYAILRTRGEDVRIVPLGEIKLEQREDCAIAKAVEYNRIKRELLKLPAAKRGSFWRIQTAEGLHDRFGGYPAEFNVRFTADKKEAGE